MKRSLAALAVLALGLLLAGPALAAPPANDEVGGALTIPDGPFPALSPLVADVTDATVTGDPPAPSCGSDFSRSVWFTFTPSQGGRYDLSTAVDHGTSSTLNDTVLAVYTSATANTPPFTEIPAGSHTAGCDDDLAANEDNQSVVTTDLVAGTRYYLVVWVFGTNPPAAGDTAVQVSASKVPDLVAPPNDTAAGAQQLPFDQRVEGTSTGAENDYQLAPASPCFTGPGNPPVTGAGVDVVYRFTAPSAGTYGFHVDGSGPQSALLALYLADSPPAGPAPAEVSCFTAVARSGSAEYADNVALTQGQSVYVFVDRRNPGTGSSFHIEATRDTRETEPNDTPATAQAAVCGILGAIDPAAEADFYALGDLPIGSRIYAMADSSGAGPSSNNDMRVNNATDTLEYDNSDLTTPFGGSAPVIAGHLTAGGQRFLQVDRNGSAPTSTSDPYRLYSVVQPLGGETAETEPNDSLAAAGTSAHDYFSGALGGPGEVDVYRFEAGVGTPIFAALDGDPARGGPPALDAKLELLDAGGNPLVSVDDGSFSSTTTPGTGDLFALDPVAPAEGLVFRPPRSGTYYLRVSAPSTPAASTGGYLLSVSLGCTTGVAPSITDTALPAGQVAKPYSHTFTATNAQGTPHWSVIGGSLPAGLGLSDSGVLSGTPTTAGDSSFEVRVTDGRGVNFSRPFSLHIAATDTTRPIVSAFKVTNSAFAPVAAKRAAKRGTRFSFRLSEPATVRITVAQRLKGKRKGKRCVKPTRKLRKKRNCTRFVTRGTLRFAGKQGANSRAFGGRFKGKALQRGRYRATLVATDAAGNKSKKKTLTFRIVRP